MKEQAAAIERLHDDVFVRQEIKHIDYADDIPKKFTKELYIITFRKIWATIRHDIWCEINNRKKNTGKLDDKEFAEIYNEIHSRFESIRGDIYELMMEEQDVPEGKAREIMQKAYVTYATISSIKNEKGEAMASKWPAQVQEILKSHG